MHTGVSRFYESLMFVWYLKRRMENVGQSARWLLYDLSLIILWNNGRRGEKEGKTEIKKLNISRTKRAFLMVFGGLSFGEKIENSGH